MATRNVHDGKPYAGNPHVRFHKGEVSSAAMLRRGSLLCKKSEKMTVATLVALSLMFAAYADSGYDSWFQQVVNDAEVFTSACWVDPADESQTKVAATAGNSYYVPAGKTAKTPNVNSTFPDAALAVAGTLRLLTWGKTYTFNDLRMLSGSVLAHGSYNYLAVCGEGQTLVIRSM